MTTCVPDGPIGVGGKTFDQRAADARGDGKEVAARKELAAVTCRTWLASALVRSARVALETAMTLVRAAPPELASALTRLRKALRPNTARGTAPNLTVDQWVVRHERAGPLARRGLSHRSLTSSPLSIPSRAPALHSCCADSRGCRSRWLPREPAFACPPRITSDPGRRASTSS